MELVSLFWSGNAKVVHWHSFGGKGAPESLFPQVWLGTTTGTALPLVLQTNQLASDVCLLRSGHITAIHF